ncbi:hypothetical protein N9W17_03225 [Jannaschia sp.]|nr:hypothetical protein [Jannaschia sp.]
MTQSFDRLIARASDWASMGKAANGQVPSRGGLRSYRRHAASAQDLENTVRIQDAMIAIHDRIDQATAELGRSTDEFSRRRMTDELSDLRRRFSAQMQAMRVLG